MEVISTSEGQNDAWTFDISTNADRQSAHDRLAGIETNAVNVFITDGPPREELFPIRGWFNPPEFCLDEGCNLSGDGCCFFFFDGDDDPFLPLLLLLSFGDLERDDFVAVGDLVRLDFFPLLLLPPSSLLSFLMRFGDLERLVAPDFPLAYPLGDFTRLDDDLSLVSLVSLLDVLLVSDLEGLPSLFS